MTEQAHVIRIDGERAVLRCFDNQGCKSCGSAFCNVKARTYEAAIGAGLEVHEHDRVEVYVPPAGAVWAGFLVLILPLLGFLLGYFIAGTSTSEPLRVLAGAAVMALAFSGVYLLSKRREQPHPRITAVLSPTAPVK